MSVIYYIKLLLLSPRYAKQSKKRGDKRPVNTICKDMVSLYKNCGISAFEYLKESIGVKTDEEREQTLTLLNHKHQWLNGYDNNWKFLLKYSGLEWQTSVSKRRQRTQAYIKRYSMGPNCKVQYGVTFIAEHFHKGNLKIGNHVLFARNVDIDVTGDLSVGDWSSISEGAKILTHNHVLDFTGNDISKGCITTPLIINDRVWIGSRAIIMPGVNEIGRGAMISADSFVRTPVPPYAIVIGNPGKIIGFRMTPQEIVAWEKENYADQDRIPMEQLQKNYESFFLKRWKEIKSITSQKA